MFNENHLTILQYIRQEQGITRRDLAGRLQVGLSMMSRLTSELIARRVIREAGRSASNGGRPSDLLSLEPSAGYAIGLDIGGQHQRGILVDLTGCVIAFLEDQRPLPATRDGILQDIESIIDRLIKQGQVDTGKVYGVGAGLWGSVDPKEGIVYSWTETPELYSTWKDFALRGALQERFAFPHIVIDDIVRALGLAEALYGTISGHDSDFIYALADTGIGVAVMIDGQPYVGPAQLAGEIGHIPVAGGNIPCSCGNTGCLETMASARAVIEQVIRKLNQSSIISTLRWAEGALSIKQVIQAAEEGDKLAFQVLTEAGEKFGIGLAITANLFGPRCIMVGGSLAASSVYLDAARRMVRLQVLGKVAGGLTIEASQLNNQAGALGAASQVLNILFSSGEHNLLSLVSRS